MKNRDYSLDIIRILACLMVVFMHSPMPTENANGYFLNVLSYLTAPCIGLFFMVSGALLLPVKTDYITFAKKRFSKMAVPTIVWSLVYIFSNLWDSESELNIVRSIASIPLSAQEGVLWFMYTLSGLYLLAPILSSWVEKASKRDLICVLSLWGLTLLYPIFDFGLDTNTSNTGILYYFTGYAGYFLLGFTLKKYPNLFPTYGCYLIALIGILLIPILKHLHIQYDFYQLFWYLSIFITAFAVGIWKSISKWSSIFKVHNSIVTISNMSFGIYLIHILIMRRWLWNISWIEGISNYVIQTIVIAILTFALSTIACWLISYLPFAKWIIAYQHKVSK